MSPRKPKTKTCPASPLRARIIDAGRGLPTRPTDIDEILTRIDAVPMSSETLREALALEERTLRVVRALVDDLRDWHSAFGISSESDCDKNDLDDLAEAEALLAQSGRKRKVR